MARKQIDYDLIEPGWRAGIKSPAQLAAEYEKETGTPVSRVAIIKHFEGRGIPRNLAAKIQAKADAIVAASEVTGLVSPETTAKEQEIVEAAALTSAQVQVSHRRDIRRGRELAMKLMGELEGITDEPHLVEQLEDALAEPAEGEDPEVAKKRRERLREAFHRVTALPSRIGSVKALSETLKNLIAIERTAHGLKAEPDEDRGAVTVVVKRYSD